MDPALFSLVSTGTRLYWKFACIQINEVISQAEATKSVLGAQRALFGSVQGKAKQLGEKFPVIRGLLGMSSSATTWH